MSKSNDRDATSSPKQSNPKISSNAGSKLVSPQVCPLGMYDQENLYPHLITNVSGIRVAVPLGDPDDSDEPTYEVAPFTYQSVPQPEFERGWWFPIKRVRLLAVDRDAAEFRPSPGAVQVRPDGSLAMYCMGFRGYTQWVPIPGCRTGKHPGNTYKKWEIIVEAGHKQSQVMVRYDADREEFEHWPEDG